LSKLELEYIHTFSPKKYVSQKIGLTLGFKLFLSHAFGLIVGTFVLFGTNGFKLTNTFVFQNCRPLYVFDLSQHFWNFMNMCL